MIEFKTEASLWRMLQDGTKTFDMRKWDLADDRIYALSWFVPLADAEHAFFAPPGYEPTRHQGHSTSVPAGAPGFKPEVDAVSFVNKETGELLAFEYLGVEFTNWAPGWGFLQLGKRVSAFADEKR